MTKAKRKRCYIYLFDAEKESLKKLAKNNGYSELSPYIREHFLLDMNKKNDCLKQQIHIKNFIQADPKILSAIARIGNNLNQVARHANERRELDKKVLMSIAIIEESMSKIVEQNITLAQRQFKLEKQSERVIKKKQKRLLKEGNNADENI